MTGQSGRLTARDILRRYQDEWLPEFVGRRLKNVNQRGNLGNCPLNVAATRGSLEELQALIEGGADVNVRGDLGCTPLHDAVGQGHIEAVRLLLTHGADRTIKNEDGKTPFDIALVYERADLADVLK